MEMLSLTQFRSNPHRSPLLADWQPAVPMSEIEFVLNVSKEELNRAILKQMKTVSIPISHPSKAYEASELILQDNTKFRLKSISGDVQVGGYPSHSMFDGVLNSAFHIFMNPDRNNNKITPATINGCPNDLIGNIIIEELSKKH